MTNLDKVLFPETGFTKGQLIDYYARIAPVMLPHLSGRPLTMKRFPDGVEGKFFFEKHAPSHTPRWVKTVKVPSERQGEISYAVVSDLPTLTWAANLGTIEFHVPLWRATGRRKLPANPDQMVFDLDPGEGTSIVECCAVAELVGEALADTHPVVLAKTSGQKGLQLYCSVPARSRWDDVRDEAHAVARQLESEHRDLVVSVMRKELRRGRVLIDWSQNHPAKTTVCVYSVRATPQPMVSTPVTLDEVGRCARTGDPGLLRFDTEQVLARVARDGDLFASLGQASQDLIAQRGTRRITSSTTSEVDASPPRSKVRTPSRAAPSVASRMALGGPGHRLVTPRRVIEDGAAGQEHGHRVGHVLAVERGCGAVRRLGHRHDGLQRIVEGQQDRLGAGDRPEKCQDQIGDAIPVAVERGHHQGLRARLGEEPGVRGVNEGRPVGHIGMAGGCRVHLLFEHAFVDRRDRPFRPSVDAAIEVGRGAERVLGDGPAD